VIAAVVLSPQLSLAIAVVAISFALIVASTALQGSLIENAIFIGLLASIAAALWRKFEPPSTSDKPDPVDDQRNHRDCPGFHLLCAADPWAGKRFAAGQTSSGWFDAYPSTIDRTFGHLEPVHPESDSNTIQPILAGRG